ncbi:MAG TPA: hypothetical protein VHO90_14615 [Bacteroidales bacterium]|nr:hypothetical protein [Bacteroidales bacterium]
MIKNILSLILMSVGVLSLQAQETEETPIVSPGEAPIVTPALKKPTLKDKMDVRVSAGSSFMYSKNFGNGLSTYVAPELSFKVTPRIHINAGIMVVNSNISINRYMYYPYEQSVVVKTNPTTSTLAYVSADYMINSRLSVSGSVLRDLTNNPGAGNYYSPSIQAMSLRMDYKLTDNISIGAGMHVQQGNSWGYPATGYGFYPASQFNPLYDY